jgi:hypothetical protein
MLIEGESPLQGRDIRSSEAEKARERGLESAIGNYFAV